MLGQSQNLSIYRNPDAGGDFGGANTDVPQEFSDIARVTAADIDFSPENSTAVISGAQKFVIPVPRFSGGGEPLIYPTDPGAQGYNEQKAGQPLVDWQGKPVGDRGVVFFNAKDRALQAAPDDGQAVIIINMVTAEQAARLQSEIEGSAGHPSRLTLTELKEVLEFARRELGLGDMYNSTRSFVSAKMSAASDPPQGADGQPIEAYGLKKRDDRDICQAVYIPGRVAFEGPAATPQLFEDGAVILRQGSDSRGIQPTEFEASYRHADGRPISCAAVEVKAQMPGLLS